MHAHIGHARGRVHGHEEGHVHEHVHEPVRSPVHGETWRREMWKHVRMGMHACKCIDMHMTSDWTNTYRHACGYMHEHASGGLVVEVKAMVLRSILRRVKKQCR